MKAPRLPDKQSLPLWPLVERYAEHLRGRQCKEKSIQGITASLHRFCAFMAQRGRGQIAQVTAVDLEAYQTGLLGLESATQQNYLVNARQFFRWLEATGQIFDNPAARLIIPRRRPRLVRVPSEAQVASLLEAADTSTLTGLRDRTWLELAYATGARRIEMYRLSVQDVDLRQALVRLFGKRDKERIVPVTRQAIRWLKRYLEEVRPKLLKGQDTSALWLSSRGGRLSYEAIQCQLSTLAHKAGLGRSVLTAHGLRRACATHLLDHGASPLMLKELLGHERAATLSHYLKQSITDVQRTHRRTAPGS